MASTNKTPNYNLSQFQPTNKLERTDYNSDMSKIDTELKKNETNLGMTSRIDLTVHPDSSGFYSSTSTPYYYVRAKILFLHARIKVDSRSSGLVKIFSGLPASADAFYFSCPSDGDVSKAALGLSLNSAGEIFARYGTDGGHYYLTISYPLAG